jgi:hypothetical protein
MPKQARLTGIKSLKCYTITEAAHAAGVTPRTIRAWSRNGLRLMDSCRPVLIRGDDLLNHMKAQRQNRKAKTGPGEFYCLSCKAARKPAGNMADCTITGHRATLMALCNSCETAMFKPVSKARLPALARILDLTIKED